MEETKQTTKRELFVLDMRRTNEATGKLQSNDFSTRNKNLPLFYFIYLFFLKPRFLFLFTERERDIKILPQLKIKWALKFLVWPRVSAVFHCYKGRN